MQSHHSQPHHRFLCRPRHHPPSLSCPCFRPHLHLHPNSKTCPRSHYAYNSNPVFQFLPLHLFVTVSVSSSSYFLSSSLWSPSSLALFLSLLSLAIVIHPASLSLLSSSFFVLIHMFILILLYFLVLFHIVILIIAPISSSSTSFSSFPSHSLHCHQHLQSSNNSVETIKLCLNPSLIELTFYAIRTVSWIGLRELSNFFLLLYFPNILMFDFYR